MIENEMCEQENNTHGLWNKSRRDHYRKKNHLEAFWLTSVRHIALHRETQWPAARQKERTCGCRGAGQGRERKPSWQRCKAGRHVIGNIWCLWSCEGCRIDHRYACSSATLTQVDLHPCLWMISTVGDSVSRSNGTSGHHGSLLQQKSSLWALPSQTNPSEGFQRDTQTETPPQNHRDSSSNHQLDVYFLRQKEGKKQMGYVWDLCGSRSQVTLSLQCASITKVLAFSDYLSHHAHH